MKTVFAHFNSIKVRLERQKVRSGDTRSIFQFHKGAIRTTPSLKACRMHNYFNSIKVRLERMKRKIL